jgi:probable F420-dependent oxidoreductase
MKLGISTFLTDDGIRPDELGPALEERGFDSLFIAEHSHIPVNRATPYPGGGELPRPYYRTLDPFVALAAIAPVTTDLLLGTGIALLIQRDVIHTAKEVATLDLLSRGRVLFGVGVGWNREEMADHGTDPRTRGALIDEQLQALTAIWTQEQAEFHGRFVNFDPIFSWPKPVQSPHPPIYVGGESDAALRRLASYGDAWLPRPGTTPAEFAAARARLAELGRHDVPMTVFGAGRDPAVLAGYAEAGVDRVSFFLATRPRDETLTALDKLAVVAQGL